MTSLELDKKLGYCVNGSDFIFNNMQFIERCAQENYYLYDKTDIQQSKPIARLSISFDINDIDEEGYPNKFDVSYSVFDEKTNLFVN